MENLAKTLPNPSPNLPKSIEKLSENAKKRNFEASCEKNTKKCDLGANLEPTWPPKAKTTFYPAVLDGIRDALSEELRSTTKAWEALMTTIQHAGGSTRPPRIVDAKRVGEAVRGSLKRRYPPKIFPKFFQNAPEVLPRTSQEPPKPFPNQARSTHETKEAPKKRPRAPKKRQHGAQERPNGGQELPQTLQNGAMEGRT